MEEQMKHEEQKHFFAFISYKREDEKWAKWLHHKLEHYKLPSNLNGRTDLPREIRPVFLDETELKAGNLPQQIQGALKNSKYLIVMCSPRSAQSEWVNKEVEAFIDMGKQDRIIPFIIDGRPYADNPTEECFPPAIRNLPKEKELLGANITEMGRAAAAVKTVAQMLGVSFDTLWQRHEREHRRRIKYIAGAILLFVIAVISIAVYIGLQNKKLKETSSRAAAESTKKLIENGNSYLARKVAEQALERAYTIEAEIALRKAFEEGSISFSDIEETKHVSFSPDGKWIFAITNGRWQKIWNVKNGKTIRQITNSTDFPGGFAFSTDGRRFACSTYSGKTWTSVIYLYDLIDDEAVLIDSLSSIGGYSSYLQFSENGKLLLSIPSNAFHRCDTVTIWEITSPKEQQLNKYHHRGVSCADLSVDGKKMITSSERGSERGTIKIWDVSSGLCLDTLIGHRDAIRSIKFDEKGAIAVSASDDSTIRVWNILTGECERVIKEMEGKVSCASISRDGKIIVSGSIGTVKIWDRETGKCLKTKKCHSGNVYSVDINPQNTHIVSCGKDWLVKYWTIGLEQSLVSKNNYSDNELKPINAIHLPNNDIAILLNKGKYYWGNQKGSYRLIIKKTDNNSKVDTLKLPQMYLGEYLSISENGRYLLVAGSHIYVWDLSNKECKALIASRDPSIFLSATISNDGKILYTSSHSILRRWDVKRGICMDSSSSFFGTIRWFPQTNRILGTSNKNIFLLNNSFHAKKSISLMGSDVLDGSSSCIDNTGKKIIRTTDRGFQIWDITHPKKYKTILGHNNIVHSVSFSPDGKYVVSSSADSTIKIWDSFSGKCVQTINGHSAVYSASFNYDGSQIITTSEDGTVCVWYFSPLQELVHKTHEQFKDNPLTPEERRQYYLE